MLLIECGLLRVCGSLRLLLKCSCRDFVLFGRSPLPVYFRLAPKSSSWVLLAGAWSWHSAQTVSYACLCGEVSQRDTRILQLAWLLGVLPSSSLEWYRPLWSPDFFLGYRPTLHLPPRSHWSPGSRAWTSALGPGSLFSLIWLFSRLCPRPCPTPRPSWLLRYICSQVYDVFFRLWSKDLSGDVTSQMVSQWSQKVLVTFVSRLLLVCTLTCSCFCCLKSTQQMNVQALWSPRSLTREQSCPQCNQWCHFWDPTSWGSTWTLESSTVVSSRRRECRGRSLRLKPFFSNASIV